MQNCLGKIGIFWRPVENWLVFQEQFCVFCMWYIALISIKSNKRLDNQMRFWTWSVPRWWLSRRKFKGFLSIIWRSELLSCWLPCKYNNLQVVAEHYQQPSVMTISGWNDAWNQVDFDGILWGCVKLTWTRSWQKIMSSYCSVATPQKTLFEKKRKKVSTRSVNEVVSKLSQTICQFPTSKFKICILYP